MCEDVEQGESKLADCLSEAIAEAENADSGGERAGRHGTTDEGADSPIQLGGRLPRSVRGPTFCNTPGASCLNETQQSLN